MRLKVCDKKCSTCVFTDRAPISPERFAELYDAWQARANETFQICHHFGHGVDGETVGEVVVCAGWWEAYQAGKLTGPGELQVADRLGWVETVPPREFNQP